MDRKNLARFTTLPATLLAILLLALLTPLTCSAATEHTVTVPAGASDFTVDVTVTEASPFAGIEFGLTMSSEAALTFSSFERGPDISGSSASPFMTTRNTHYFGFYSTKNLYGGTVRAGKLHFTYAGNGEQTITLSHMMVVRMDESGNPSGDRRTAPILVIHVRRGTSTPGTDPDTGGTANPGSGEATNPGTGANPGSAASGSTSAGPDLAIEIVDDSKAPLSAGVKRSKYFSDVDEQVSWAVDAVDGLYEQGVVKGITARLYGPTRPITRGDFMLMLVRAFQLQAAISGNFADVPVGSHYGQAVAVAKALGIAQGDGIRFNPAAPITRQDMMVLVDRTLTVASRTLPQTGDSSLTAYTDRGGLAGYAGDAAARLVGSGIIKGSGSRINPLGNTTRAEMAVVISRLLALQNR